MRRFLLLLTATLTFMQVPAALAVQPDEVLSDPALEQRARALSKQLRCMVCQNQSIDDSDAPLARDLRILVRDRLRAGDKDQEVMDFLTARYGEFVLLKPSFSTRTALLWLTPVGALLLGALGIALLARRHSPVEPSLTPEEQARLTEILRAGER
jgi:cytochrome c-type biogenesis protein CcmH